MVWMSMSMELMLTQASGIVSKIHFYQIKADKFNGFHCRKARLAL